MTSFVNQLQEQLKAKLFQIETETNNPLKAAKRAFSAARDVVARMQEYISGYTFKDRQEEIRFYKEVEPSFHALLIYYARLYRIERSKPVGSKGIIKAFFEEELNKIYLFFRENEDFYKYYRSGADFMDDTFFIPDGDTSEIVIDEYSCIIDTQTCTVLGYKAACIKAFEKLQVYLNGQLAQAEGLSNSQPTGSNCKWTGSKVALTELMYALVYSGMINNGQIQVKELAELLETIFQINLGNYYRTRQEMYSRKETASFLELLMKRFRQGMDEADERFRS